MVTHNQMGSYRFRKASVLFWPPRSHMILSAGLHGSFPFAVLMPFMFYLQPEEKCQSEVRNRLGSDSFSFSVLITCCPVWKWTPQAGNPVSISVDSKAAARAGCLPGKGVCADHPADCKCECRFQRTHAHMCTRTRTRARACIVGARDKTAWVQDTGLSGSQGWDRTE